MTTITCAPPIHHAMDVSGRVLERDLDGGLHFDTASDDTGWTGYAQASSTALPVPCTVLPPWISPEAAKGS